MTTKGRRGTVVGEGSIEPGPGTLREWKFESDSGGSSRTGRSSA